MENCGEYSADIQMPEQGKCVPDTAKQPTRAAVLPREERRKIVERLLAQRGTPPPGDKHTVGELRTPGSIARAQKLLQRRQSSGWQTPEACGSQDTARSAIIELKVARVPAIDQRIDKQPKTPRPAFGLLELLAKDADGPLEISQTFLYTPATTTAPASPVDANTPTPAITPDGKSQPGSASRWESLPSAPIQQNAQGSILNRRHAVASEPAAASKTSIQKADVALGKLELQQVSRQKLCFDGVVMQAEGQTDGNSFSVQRPEKACTRQSKQAKRTMLREPECTKPSRKADATPEEQFTKEPSSTVHLSQGKEPPEEGKTAFMTQRRLEHLSQPRTSHWEKCAQQKAAEDYRELVECTFAPRTLKRPSKVKSAPTTRFGERLYRKANPKNPQMEHLRAEQQQRELEDCTFQPAINKTRSNVLHHVPLHERLAAIQRQRREKLLRIGKDTPVPSFKPTINANSVKLAEARELRQLGIGAESRQSGACVQRSHSVPVEVADCTFSPSINPTSERLLEDSRAVPSDFFARQRFFHDLKEHKMRHLQTVEEFSPLAQDDRPTNMRVMPTRIQEDQECSFRPEISPVSEIIVAAKKEDGLPSKETPAEVAERLSTQHAQQQEAARKAQERQYYQQFTFKPAINARSQQMVEARPLEELASNATSQKAQQRALQLEEENRRHCTFQPDLSKPEVHGDNKKAIIPSAAFTIHGQSAATLSARVEAYEQQRQAHIEQRRAEKQSKELEGCSFVPSLCKVVHVPQDPLPVKGLQNYLDKIEMAKRQNQEKEAREAKVFHKNPRMPSGKPTVPKPPKLSDLSGQEVEARKAQLAETRLVEIMKECSFSPQTNERQKRELLRTLLVGTECTPCLTPDGSDLSLCEREEVVEHT